MKKLLQILFAVAIILVGLTACKKSTKQQLIGTWHCAKTITIDNGNVTINGTQTINEDGTYSEVYNLIWDLTQEEDGTNVEMKIGISGKDYGQWTLNDKEIVSSPNSVNLKVTSVKYYDPSDGSFLGALTGNDLAETANELEQEMKKGLLEASTERIIMMQDNKYVTESIDEDDGTKTTYTYNRVR